MQAVIPYQCLFTDDVGYLLFSSTISFYLPLAVMVYTYCRIYVVASKQTRSLKLGVKQVELSSITNGGNSSDGKNSELTLRIHRGGQNAHNIHYHSVSHSALTLNRTESGHDLKGSVDHLPGPVLHHPMEDADCELNGDRTAINNEANGEGHDANGANRHSSGKNNKPNPAFFSRMRLSRLAKGKSVALH